MVAGSIGGVSSATRAAWDADICARIASLDEFAVAEQLIAYLALSDEPSLTALLELAIEEDKTIFVPLVDRGDSLTMYRWTPADGTEIGAYAAWTPSVREGPAVRPSLSLVPGRAFDVGGHRVGRGKGCYDRAMDALGALGLTVGTAYDCQVFDAVPRRAHDRSVGCVVTPSRTIWPARVRSGPEAG